MSTRGRSTSPHPLENHKPHDGDVDMDSADNANAKVVTVTNLTRNVVESHLRAIFSFYGEIVKLDLPTFTKSGQNKGKASLEFSTSSAAHKAKTHMDGGQLDGAVLKIELSNSPMRSPSRSRFGRGGGRSYSRSRSRSRGNFGGRWQGREARYGGDSYRGGAGGSYGGRRAPIGRDLYRPGSRSWSRSRTRSRSPVRRIPGRLGPRRRSPSYERGGYGRGRGRTRSRSYTPSSRSRSYSYSPSRSRTRSLSRSRSRSRSRSYSSHSRYSRSRSRSSSGSRGRRSYSRDDIRDSRSRSPRSSKDD